MSYAHFNRSYFYVEPDDSNNPDGRTQWRLLVDDGTFVEMFKYADHILGFDAVVTAESPRGVKRCVFKRSDGRWCDSNFTDDDKWLLDLIYELTGEVIPTECGLYE